MLAAIEGGEAQNPGFARIARQRLHIELWEQRGRSYDWLLWAAQPAEPDGFPDLDVRQLIERRPPRSFVAYLPRPTEDQVEASERCLG